MAEDLPTLHTVTGILPSESLRAAPELFMKGFPTFLAFVSLYFSVMLNKEALVKHFPHFLHS